MIMEEIFKQHFFHFIDDYGGDSQAAKSRFSSSICFTLYMIMEEIFKQHFVRFIDDYGGDFQATFCSLYK